MSMVIAAGLAILAVVLTRVAWLVVEPRPIRLVSVGALILIGPLILLALVWPSLHTLFGLAALPGIILLAAAVVWPKLLARYRVARFVVISALLCAAGSYSSQALWDYNCHTLEFIIPNDFVDEIYLIQDSEYGVELQNEGYRINVPMSGVVRVRDDDFMFRCFSTEAHYKSGDPVDLIDRGVTGGSRVGHTFGIGPEYEGNIHRWMVQAR